jgi:bacterial/archaeal transporter family-2 protein
MNAAMMLGIAMAMAAGACLAVQAGVNGRLARGLGSSSLAAFASFAVGTLVIAVYLLVTRAPFRAALAGAAAIPVWVWFLGGALGSFYVISVIYLAPKLGAATTLGWVVAGQMLAGLLLDHLGALSFPQHAISAPRLVGAALIVGGAVLIRAY